MIEKLAIKVTQLVSLLDCAPGGDLNCSSEPATAPIRASVSLAKGDLVVDDRCESMVRVARGNPTLTRSTAVTTAVDK